MSYTSCIMPLMSKQKITLGGSEALLGAAILFAFTNVLVRDMAHMWGDQAQLVARFALVWLLMTIYMKVKRQKATIPRSKMVPAIAYSFCAAFAILLFTLSVQATTIANTLFTSSAVELVIAFILGTFILRERVNTAKIASIVLALLGLSLYTGGVLDGDLGLIYALFAGVLTAFCNLLAKQLKGVSLGATLRIQFGIGALIMAVLTLVLAPDDIIRVASVDGVVTTVVFALVLLVANHLVLYGFQHSDVNIASVILSSQLAFGALIGYWVYSEIPTSNELYSGVMIICAAVLASIAYRRTSKEIDVHA